MYPRYPAMPGADHLGGAQPFQPSHWSQPGLEPAVVGFDLVVRVPGIHVMGGGQLFVEDPRVGRSAVGGHLGWPAAVGQRPGEKPAGRGSETPSDHASAANADCGLGQCNSAVSTWETRTDSSGAWGRERRLSRVRRADQGNRDGLGGTCRERRRRCGPGAGLSTWPGSYAGWACVHHERVGRRPEWPHRWTSRARPRRRGHICAARCAGC